MSYCGPRGIAHGTFKAWPEKDQDLALAWQTNELRKCVSCGTIPEQWITEKPDGARVPVRPPPYEPDVVVCFGCETRERFTKSIKEEDWPKGGSVVLVPADRSTYDLDESNGVPVFDPEI